MIYRCNLFPCSAKIRRDHSLFDKTLQAFHNTEFSMLPGQSPLEVNSIGWFDRAVCGKLNRGTGNKGTCSHDHRAVIAWHIPRFRCYMPIYRCCLLDSPAESNHTLRLPKGYCLNDIIPGLGTIRHNRKSKLFINVCSKNGILHGICRNRGCQKESLIKGWKCLQESSYFSAKSRCCQTAGCILDTFFFAGKVATMQIISERIPLMNLIRSPILSTDRVGLV